MRLCRFLHLRFLRFSLVLLRCRYTSILDWRFGNDPSDMKLGFSMQFFPGKDETLVEWSYKGD